jgi:hypothetical protein
MGIQFNGNVTINGDVEVFDNGSMKITGNQLNVSIEDLPKLIEDNLKYSSNKEEYLQMSKDLKDSNDEGIIKKAIEKFKKMGKELSKSVVVSGLSSFVLGVIKNSV